MELAAGGVIEDFQAAEHFFSVCLVRKDALHLGQTKLHGSKIPGQKKPSAVQQTDMVADVLQLTQVVGGDDRRQAPLGHIIGKNTLDSLAHHGIQTVEGFVAQQILRIGAQPAQDSELFFHASGIMLDPPFWIQTEIPQQPVEPHRVKRGIDSLIISAHVAGVSIPEKIGIIRDKENLFLHVRMVVDRLPGYLDLPGILTKDPAYQPQERALARAVGPDQPEYLPVFNIQGYVVYRSDRPESFFDIFYLNHCTYSPVSYKFPENTSFRKRPAGLPQKPFRIYADLPGLLQQSAELVPQLFALFILKHTGAAADETSPAPHGIQKTLPLQFHISPLNGVGVGRKLHRELADRRHLFVGRQDLLQNQHFVAFNDLLIDRPAVLIIDEIQTGPPSREYFHTSVPWASARKHV